MWTLTQSLQDRILEFCIQALSARVFVDPISFTSAYRYCRITRNLQILGAFGYLTRVKGKSGFDAYIPAALRTLNRSLSQLRAAEFPEADTYRRPGPAKTREEFHETV